ncbi:MAG: T9SS type A sorting domain-containing protein [Candidatus Electryonea clarkiae]|nr:T9SS type A sorting domain-containing protein [Candidatus Electryonea clarkiae]MDP8287761.1 T9SS type A sorting domain-containing protein [Candidatus Electryonea clarkiae]
MRYYPAIFLIAFLSIFCISTTALSEYNFWGVENGLVVRQGPHIHPYIDDIMHTASNDDGEFCVVWTAFTNSSQEIFAQLCDSESNPEWGEDGVQLTNGLYIQNDPLVISAGEYGWYICWKDYWIDEENRNRFDARFQLLDSYGTPQWDQEGINLTPDNCEPLYYHDYAQTNDFILPSLEGSFIALWRDDHEIYANRFDYNGESLWDGFICIAVNASDVEVTTDLSGGIIFVFEEYQGDRAMMNKVNTDGELLWADSTGMEMMTDWFDGSISMISDGEGGTFITWHNYIDSNAQACGQQIDSDGNLLWNPEGVVLVPENVSGEALRTVLISPGSFALSWINSGRYEIDYRVRIKKIESINGEPVSHWGDEEYGLLLSDRTTNRDWLVSDGEGGVVVAWRAYETDENEDEGFELLRVEQDGTIAWDSPTLINSNRTYHTWLTPMFCGDNVVCVWRDPRNHYGGIYTNSFDLESGDSFNDDDIAVVEDLEGRGKEPKIMRSGESAYVCWTDNRTSINCRLPFMQRIDLESGEIQWDGNGINTVPGMVSGENVNNDYCAHDLQIYTDNNDGAIAACILVDWSNYTSGRLYAQRINEDGDPLWGERGYCVPIIEEEEGNSVSTYHASASEDGGIFLFYYIYYDEMLPQVRGQRLDSDGTPLWNEPYGIEVVPSEYVGTLLGIEQTESGDIIVFYSKGNEEHEVEFYAIKINSNGELAWEEPVLLMTCDRNRAELFDAIRVDTCLVIRMGRRMYSQNQLNYFVCLNENGELGWDGDSLRIYRGMIRKGNLVPGIDDEFWIIRYLDGDYELYHYNLDAELLTEQPVVFRPARSLRYVCPDGAGGLYLLEDRFLHYNRDGELVNEENANDPVVLSNLPYLHAFYDYVPDGEGGMLTTWGYCADRTTENTGDDYDIHVMRINDGTAGVEKKIQNIIPSQITISPAYPNPFNSSTKVSVALPEHSQLVLSIFNITGQQVSTLANDSYSPGYHKFTFNADELPSGIYFIHASVPGKMNEIRKVVLIR